MKQITHSELLALLDAGIVEFTYTKTDGTDREAVGTTSTPELMKLIHAGKLSMIPGSFIASNGALTYWDIEADGWRTVSAGATVTIESKATTSTPATTSTTSTGKVSASQLIPMLSSQIVKFEYLKKDKSTRVAYGTTDPTRVPAGKAPHNHAASTVITYWDVEQQDLRAVSIDENPTVNVIDTFDVPLK